MNNRPPSSNPTVSRAVNSQTPLDRPDTRNALDPAVALSLLAGSVRMQLLRLLASGPQCVGDAAQAIGVGLSLASHNLRLLERAGLVVATRHRRKRVYSLDGVYASVGSNGLQLNLPVPHGWTIVVQCPIPASNWAPVSLDRQTIRAILDHAPQRSP
jgi:DNA-binding transcriptional ArsR family regulator